MATIVVSVIKEATAEVDTTVARQYLTDHGLLTQEDMNTMSDSELAECYVAWAEGKEFDLDFDRNIHILQEVK